MVEKINFLINMFIAAVKNIFSKKNFRGKHIWLIGGHAVSYTHLDVYKRQVIELG